MEKKTVVSILQLGSRVRVCACEILFLLQLLAELRSFYPLLPSPFVQVCA